MGAFLGTADTHWTGVSKEGSVNWWQIGIIYQIYPRSFQDSNRDGVGDIPGIIERLPYLVELGIDAIWLSPIFPSPMADFGYDIADYLDVDPLFGSIADLDRLIEAAHQRDLKVLLDLVPNHTSDQHPWFIRSRASLDNPQRDWYIWREPGPTGRRRITGFQNSVVADGSTMQRQRHTTLIRF
jgi:alpha-glucosidase